MSSTPALSSLNPATKMYPLLTEGQIARVRAFARQRSVEAGEVLYRPGDVSVPVFILLSAYLEVVQPDGEGERPIGVLQPSMFTGEAGMIGGQRCVALGRVIRPGVVLEIPHEDVRGLVARDAELGEIFLRAFMLRRINLIAQQLGNVIVIGSRHSVNTMRSREFPGRNGHPYTYVDLDTDVASQRMLDRLSITLEEIPIVICNNRAVLRNPSTLELAAMGFLLMLRCGLPAPYWTSVFPAVLTLGLGLAVTVAPLSTAVMQSLPAAEAGIASGVNNAVSRIAALLTVAAFGLVLTAGFNRSLDGAIRQMVLSSADRQALARERSKLAGAQIEDPQLRLALDRAFVVGFHDVLWISAVLAMLGACSAQMLSAKGVASTPTQTH